VFRPFDLDPCLQPSPIPPSCRTFFCFWEAHPPVVVGSSDPISSTPDTCCSAHQRTHKKSRSMTAFCQDTAVDSEIYNYFIRADRACSDHTLFA
jgi:hypothetical protein